MTIELLPALSDAAAVVVEPVDAADWEVVELNAELLEKILLGQVGLRFESICIPVSPGFCSYCH